MAMILVLDNYDSFTYNLVQYLGELGVDLQVRRNDEITIDQIRALNRSEFSSPPARVRRAKPVCPMMSSARLPAKAFRFLASALGISASGTHSARKSW